MTDKYNDDYYNYSAGYWNRLNKDYGSSSSAGSAGIPTTNTVGTGSVSGSITWPPGGLHGPTTRPVFNLPPGVTELFVEEAKQIFDRLQYVSVPPDLKLENPAVIQAYQDWRDQYDKLIQSWENLITVNKLSK